jgi:hypothetical protein
MQGALSLVKEPCSRAQLRPLVLINLEKVAQGLGDVVGVNSLAPRATDGVHHPLAAKQVQDHLLATVAMDLGPNRAWCSLLKLKL